MRASIQAIGNWDAQVGAGLHDALQASMEIIGRSGEEACRHALILMCESASAMTPTAGKSRPVEKDETGEGSYRTIYNQRVAPHRMYKWSVEKAMWDRASRIANSGMAKRSWFWGLGVFNHKRSVNSYKRGYKLYTFAGSKVCGYIYANGLSYINKIMPAGWTMEVSRLASNKIMAQARDKLQRRWQRAMGAQVGSKGPKLSNRQLADYFTRLG